jgi:hypothetical protein
MPTRSAGIRYPYSGPIASHVLIEGLLRSSMLSNSRRSSKLAITRCELFAEWIDFQCVIGGFREAVSLRRDRRDLATTNSLGTSL